MATLLSINNYFYRRGGAEVVFLEHNRLFEERGWQVIPFCMQHPQNLSSEWSQYFVDEIEFGEGYGLWEKLRRVPKVIYSMEAQQKLGALLRAHRANVAHAHNVYHHLSPSIFAVLHRAGVPTALTLHDLKIACPAYKMLTHDGVCERCRDGHLSNVIRHRCVKNSLPLGALVFLEAKVNRWLGSYSRYVDRFVVPSRFYLEKFVEWGWPRERFVHIPNFVSVESLVPGGGRGGYYLYFGRLGHEKGLTTLVRAAAMAQVKVVIAGAGPEEAGLRSLAAQLSAPVEFAGYKTGEALHALIRAARATVLPSEWYENAPMSVKESYALGTPVVGARIGGIPELIKEEETGRLFASGSVEALAAELCGFETLSDSRLREMGMAGRAWMAAEYTPQRYVERTQALYAGLGAG